MRRLILASCLSLAALTCRSKKVEPKPEAEKPAVVASAPTPVASAAELTPEPEPPELPTESDYEEEASEQIKGSNLEKQLDQLEKELLGR